jgi:hypothetical protein
LLNIVKISRCEPQRPDWRWASRKLFPPCPTGTSSPYFEVIISWRIGYVLSHSMFTAFSGFIEASASDDRAPSQNVHASDCAKQRSRSLATRRSSKLKE